jgi:hypothetical protein
MEEEKKKGGRPKGAKNNVAVLKLRKFVTTKEIERFVNLAKKQAEKDPVLLKFILEQIFGKAAQSVDMTVTPQATRFASLEEKLKLINNDNAKYIDGEVIEPDTESGADALQDGQGAMANPNPGENIRPDLETPASEEPHNVPHEVREELCDSVGGADQNNNLCGEVGDNRTIGQESQDNNVLPD